MIFIQPAAEFNLIPTACTRGKGRRPHRSRRQTTRQAALASPTAAGPVWSDPPGPSGGNTQGEHKAAPAEKHGDSNYTINTAPNAPILVKIQHTQEHGPVSAKTESERSWYATPDWWVAGFTGLLFGATAGLWIFTALLWGTTKQAVTDAANIGVEVPRFAIDLASMIIGENVEIAARNGWPTVRLKNHGRTAAEMVFERVEILIADELPPQPIYSLRSPIKIGTIVPPNGTHTTTQSPDDRNRRLMTAEMVRPILRRARRANRIGRRNRRDARRDHRQQRAVLLPCRKHGLTPHPTQRRRNPRANCPAFAVVFRLTNFTAQKTRVQPILPIFRHPFRHPFRLIFRHDTRALPL